MFDNVLGAEEFSSRLKETSEKFYEILKPFAGPFAANALIGSKWRQINDVDEFTKDGIKIAAHLISSEDPVERLVARLARFVGFSVDSRCHDGTTTSMLLFAQLAILADELIPSSVDSRTRQHTLRKLNAALRDCLTTIDELKITPEEIVAYANGLGFDTNIDDVRAALAYHMSMIASKGDTDLSQKIAKLIRMSPNIVGGMITHKPLAVETKTRYELIQTNYDLQFKSIIGNMDDLNYMSGTQWLSEDVAIFSTPNDIVTSSWESMFLLSFISTKPQWRADLFTTFNSRKGWEDYHGNKKHLIIIAPMIQDMHLTEEVNDFNNRHPHIKISFFISQAPKLLKQSYDKALHYMAGKPIFGDCTYLDPTRSIIGLEGPGAKAHFLGSVLNVSNLYEKTGEPRHPYYSNPDLYAPYTEFLKEQEKLIQFAQDNITNVALSQEEVSKLIWLMRCLTCQEVYEIEIGGTAHEQRANQTVYEDAIGASLSAITDGVVLGGYGHIVKRAIIDNPDSSELLTKIGDAVTQIVAESCRCSVEDVQRLMGQLDSKWDYIVADRDIYETTDGDYVFKRTLGKDTMKSFLSMDPNTPVLVQAWSGYEEQFTRFNDIITKLAGTSCLIDMRVHDADAIR